jgi:hypothetical protein
LVQCHEEKVEAQGLWSKVAWAKSKQDTILTS